MGTVDRVVKTHDVYSTAQSLSLPRSRRPLAAYVAAPLESM